jgi:DNA-dependent RNA polymerase auxiliary subunit epsilon
MGYIESPLKKDGEINYTQLAKLVKETFETETTESTLSKYLNLESEKGQETVRKFNSNNFNIPHLKTIS